MFSFNKPWVKMGMTEEVWNEIPKDDQDRLVATQFTRKPCAICKKSVMVLKTHEGDTWCSEHGGSWKEANVR